MVDNFRHFEVGPDPFGRNWTVEFKWLQTAISIRHADTVDVKFIVSDGEERAEKILALSHPDLLRLSDALNRPLTDPWCMKLAALHLKEMIETGGDVEKTLVKVPYADLERHAAQLQEAAACSRKS